MRVRRVLVSVAAAVMLAGGGSLAVAPSASAVQTLTASCDRLGSQSITVQPSEVITVLFTGSNCAGNNNPAEGSFYTYADFGSSQTYTILGSKMPGDSVSVTYFNSSLEPLWVLTFVVGGTPTPTRGAVAPIPAWVQAYGIFHHDDACLTSWTNSWQKWAEPITGGWVCTRTIPSLG
jgi:hypothetical protein